MAENRLSQIQGHLSHEDLVLVTRSTDKRVVTLTINNAAKANCLSTPVLKALLATLKSLNPNFEIDASIDTQEPNAFATQVCDSHGSNPIPRVVIIKSAGRIFCSGHDLREFRATKGDYNKIHEIFALCNIVMLTIRRLPQLVISQVSRMTWEVNGRSKVSPLPREHNLRRKRISAWLHRPQLSLLPVFNEVDSVRRRQ